MRRTRAIEIQNAVAPYGLIVAKEMPMRLVLEKKLNNTKNNAQ